MLTGKAGKEFSKWFVSDECLRFGDADDFILTQSFAETQNYQMWLTPTTNRKWSFSIIDHNTGNGITNEFRGELEPTMTKAVERLNQMINDEQE